MLLVFWFCFLVPHMAILLTGKPPAENWMMLQSKTHSQPCGREYLCRWMWAMPLPARVRVKNKSCICPVLLTHGKHCCFSCWGCWAFQTKCKPWTSELSADHERVLWVEVVGVTGTAKPKVWGFYDCSEFIHHKEWVHFDTIPCLYEWVFSTIIWKKHCKPDLCIRDLRFVIQALPKDWLWFLPEQHFFTLSTDFCPVSPAETEKLLAVCSISVGKWDWEFGNSL